MTKCKMCGKCCQAIVLPFDFNHIKVVAERESKHKDGQKTSSFCFAVRNFKEISKEKALEINPYIENWPNEQEIQFFYKCKQYEPISKKCNVHSIRPEVCSGFPFYGREPFKQAMYSKNCAFQKDIKKL